MPALLVSVLILLSFYQGRLCDKGWLPCQTWLGVCIAGENQLALLSTTHL